MGDRLMAGQQTLNLFIQVRILASQPTRAGLQRYPHELRLKYANQNYSAY